SDLWRHKRFDTVLSTGSTCLYAPFPSGADCDSYRITDSTSICSTNSDSTTAWCSCGTTWSLLARSAHSQRTWHRTSHHSSAARPPGMPHTRALGPTGVRIGSDVSSALHSQPQRATGDRIRAEIIH